MKTYTCGDGIARIQHIRSVYQRPKEAGVPNTDSLVAAKDNSIFLEPIGLAIHPQTPGQLKECILCILDALIVRMGTFYYRGLP